MSPTNRTARDSDVLALMAPWLLFGRHGKEQLQPIVDTLCGIVTTAVHGCPGGA